MVPHEDPPGWRFAALIISLILPAFSAIVGCAGYGKVIPSPVSPAQAPEFIAQHYKDFHAFYSGPENAPAAIMLDRKDDGVQLTGQGWHPIESKTQLDGMVSAMKANYRFWGVDAQGPELSMILGKNSETIGYLFSPIRNTPVRPDGANYTVDSVTDVEVREKANPGIKGAGG
jgi:hypothetical protein